MDARAGPGIKSMTKFKVKNRKHAEDKPEKKMKKLFVREDSPVSDKSEANDEIDYGDYLLEDGPSGDSSRAASPVVSDCEEIGRNRRFRGIPKRRKLTDQNGVSDNQLGDFVDPEYWKRYFIISYLR